MSFENTLAFARKMDRNDPLRSFRSEFLLPPAKGKKWIYFTGNSLGLQPRTAHQWIGEELSDWANLGVEGHVLSRRPWLYYHKFAKKSLARLTGAKPTEVVAMNQLTVNLHLMMVSFYRPTAEKHLLVVEKGAFPSDQYAFESQIRLHGFDPSSSLVEIAPHDGQGVIETSDIINTLQKHQGKIALVLLSGVQYYSGQLFDIRTITRAAHEAGAFVGFDLAHAIGNVPLSLHRDNVDFAVWCSYKYLNSGPGSIAGAFVHERHGKDGSLPRLAGWWGHHEKERFEMKPGFKPMPGVDGWQLSNFPVLAGAAHLASLEIFDRAGVANLRRKSLQLTGFLEFVLQSVPDATNHFQLLTPSDPKQRGCQLSIYMKQNGRKVFEALTKQGVIADWREPNVIRVAPVPLYNTFEDVYRFGDIFKQAVTRKSVRKS